ncbi:hypothetical protein [Streptomyces sp. TRM68367]|uniref:hypothetical protein n=1 Tax=Streptomyces sp. TRM68367 TaxID=2758415 RepID=UPI00165A1A41|nr:hypothetical protein [Streptomyces sp. TRM68367]MBC9728130.1 hypothetical protein [Streptomyces sp. TRM68367]
MAEDVENGLAAPSQRGCGHRGAARVAAIRDTYPGPLDLGGPLLIVDTSRPADSSALATKTAHALEAGRGSAG